MTANRQPNLLLSLEEKVDRDHSAVVVIDVQNDFIAPGGWADQVGREISFNQAAAEQVEGFLTSARLAQVPVIFVQGIYDEIYLGEPQLERNIRLGIDVPRCLSGSWGADFYLVKPLPGEPIVQKHRYSAFVETDLPTLLRHMGTRTLILAGVYTDGCVESTARDGFFLDYYVVMVEDCCATLTEEAHLSALARCERSFGVTAASTAITAAWGVD